MTDNDTNSNQAGGCIDHTDPEVLKRLYHDRGLTLKEISERSSVTRGAIGYQMKKNGIERRSRGTKEGERLVTHTTYCMEGHGCMSWYSRDPDGKQRCMKVHRLVAIAEWGVDAVAGNHVHHKNEIPWDNRPSNLEVKTPEDHHSDHMSGSSHPQSKLTESDVRDILSRVGGDETQKEIAEDHGIAHTTVSMIKSGDLWPHVGDRD